MPLQSFKHVFSPCIHRTHSARFYALHILEVRNDSHTEYCVYREHVKNLAQYEDCLCRSVLGVKQGKIDSGVSTQRVTIPQCM